MPDSWHSSDGHSEAGGDALLIVGASVRAAAQSAVRAGLRPWSVDLFADRDTRACGAWRRVFDYPHGIAAALDAAPAGEWMYTGALENWPELVDAWAVKRRLLGVAGECLRRVRDPLGLHGVLRAASFSSPQITLNADGLPTDGSWLCKPLRSAGGRGVHAWRGESVADREVYFQRRIDGELTSAVFVANGGDAALLGITRQLAGCEWAGASGFQYCGSIGPLQLQAGLRKRIADLGRMIAAEFALVGLFGVDLVMVGDEAWPLEVNPRYTASVEILERAVNFNALGLHVAGCHRQALPVIACEENAVWGKAIVYAKHSLTTSDELSNAWWQTNYGPWPALADLPVAGTRIERGQPVLTVFRSGDSLAAVERELRNACETIYGQLEQMSPAASNTGA